MEVKIEKYDDLGQGLARIDNKVCFIKKALQDEVVDIKIIKDNKKYSVGKLLKVEKKSKNRCEPICQFYDSCGGCQFLHALYEAEENYKITKAENYFSKCDAFHKTKEYYYRNKVVFHVQNGLIGYYQETTNTLVEISYCYLLEPKINQVLSFLKDLLPKDFSGQVMIRVNKQEETLVVINGKYKDIDLLTKSSLINNLIYNNQIIKGKDYFIEEIFDYKFKVHYHSFFQVNRLGLLEIFKFLEKTLKNKKINQVLDLYSGTSVLGIYLSKFANQVISVEANRFASEDAKINAKLNKISNLKIINGLVEDYIDTFTDIDLVLVDPSRKGLDQKTINYILEMKPNYIIYIACQAISLKRDLAYLENDYQIATLDVIDMFPKTNHMETLCFLEKSH